MGCNTWKLWLLTTVLTRVATGQRVGNWTKEVHPLLKTWQCTYNGGCHSKNTSVVLEEKQRYMHVRGMSTSCKNSSSSITSTYCIDSESCYNNCEYEGANYPDSGVTTNGSAVRLNLIVGQRKFVNPRVYLLDETGLDYEKVVLGPNTEFTYDTDMSLTHTGAQSALYMVQMDWDGGRNKYSPGGASMGTGYCDSQCFKKEFLNGQVNVNVSGSCCAELDIYEGTRDWFSIATHPCKYNGSFYACNGVDCEHTTNGGICSQRDCNFASMGTLGGASHVNAGYFGKGLPINTLRPMTVITQFLTKDNYQGVITDQTLLSNRDSMAGTLVSMRRYYQQDGKLYTNAPRGNINVWMEVTDTLCATNGMALAGGMAAGGEYMKRGTALTMALFFGGGSSNFWLDDIRAYANDYPGVTAVTPAMVADHQKTAVTFSNIRWGELGSTFKTDGTDWAEINKST